MSAEKFAKLGKRVSIVIFFGHNYVYSKDERAKWKIQVKFVDSGTSIEFELLDEDLDALFTRAYQKLDSVVSTGLGHGAMLPAIEHKPETVTTNDEIPF